MGYRFYIGKIDNTSYELMSSANNKEELAKIAGVDYSKDDDYLWIGDIFNKYSIDQISDMVSELHINRTDNPFFKDKSLNESFNAEMDLVLLSKENLLELIHKYEVSTLEFFQRKLKEIQQLATDKNYTEMEYVISSHFSLKISEWNEGGVVNKKDDTPLRIVDSWQIEYGVFDLIYLYKTTDFEKERLFFFAH